MRITRIIASAAVAIGGLYALGIPLWMIAVLAAAMAALVAWDNLYGVHAETRRLMARGRALAEEVRRLPQSY